MRVEINTKRFELYCVAGSEYSIATDTFTSPTLRVRLGRYTWSWARGWRRLAAV